MQYKGTITEFDDDIDLDEFHYEIDDAVVTDTRISIEWDEDGQKCFAKLQSTNGFTFSGVFGTPLLNNQ